MPETPEQAANDPAPAAHPLGAATKRRLKLLVAATALVGLALAITPARGLTAPAALPGPGGPAGAPFAEPQGATGDYSKFNHANAAHAGLPCLLCHRRETSAPQ